MVCKSILLLPIFCGLAAALRSMQARRSRLFRPCFGAPTPATLEDDAQFLLMRESQLQQEIQITKQREMQLLRDQEARLQEDVATVEVATPAPAEQVEKPSWEAFWEELVSDIQAFVGPVPQQQNSAQESSLPSSPETGTSTQAKVSYANDEEAILSSLLSTETKLEDTRVALREANLELAKSTVRLQDALEETMRSSITYAAELKGLKQENDELRQVLENEKLQTEKIAKKQKSIPSTFLLLTGSIFLLAGKIVASPVTIPISIVRKLSGTKAATVKDPSPLLLLTGWFLLLPFKIVASPVTIPMSIVRKLSGKKDATVQ